MSVPQIMAMARVFRKPESQKNPPVQTAMDLLFCIFDDKRRLRHRYGAAQSDSALPERFRYFENPVYAFENAALLEAAQTKQPTSMNLSFGNGQRLFFFVLPYERKWKKWQYACLLIMAESAADGLVGSLEAGRTCLLLVNGKGSVCAVSPGVPVALGYSAGQLTGRELQDLFSVPDVEKVLAASADTPEPVHSCAFHCLDGSRRDVELRKFSAPDQYMLYTISDVTPDAGSAELAEVGIRERRRIGQDLHDSIGQLLTGISLLSRSLANGLRKSGRPDYDDAVQVSELADRASNQIRQVSRSLMPTEIVQAGLKLSLGELAMLTSASCGVECVAVMDETIEFSDGAVESHLYRIAQEAVNNAVRHADAKRIEIDVRRLGDAAELTVTDDGTWKIPHGGYDGGIGLKTMEYRAQAIGGRLEVGPCAEGGTRVRCCVEVDEGAAAFPETKGL